MGFRKNFSIFVKMAKSLFSLLKLAIKKSSQENIMPIQWLSKQKKTKGKWKSIQIIAKF